MAYDLRKENMLGKGTHGVVYYLDEKTAIKKIYVEGDESKRQQTLKEIIFMMNFKVNKGPGDQHVLAVKGFKEDDEFIYIEMDRANGSMAQVLYGEEDFYKQLPMGQLLDICRQTFHGLEYLHGQNVLHLDIKPDNILFFDMTVKLCDFGLSRKKTNLFTTSVSNLVHVGTAAYMAPEIHVHGKQGQKYSDIWSAGLVMVEWLTGTRPWKLDPASTDKAEILNQKKAGLMPDGLDRVPDEVRPLLDACLSYDPKARPTAAEVRQQFEELAAKHSQIPAAPHGDMETAFTYHTTSASTSSGTLVHSGMSYVFDSGNGHSMPESLPDAASEEKSIRDTSVKSPDSTDETGIKGNRVDELKSQFEALGVAKKKKVPTATLR